MSANNPDVHYKLLKTLKTPSAVSSISFGHAGHLFVGTDDGILRVYDLSTFKVIKAVRNLENEVSSIICMKRPGSDLRDAWIACGTKILKFRMDTSKMIQTCQDTLDAIELGATQDELINEIGVNFNKTHIAFSTDKGAVGVVDLSTKSVSKMSRGHANVCTCVKFIPTRPKEMVSGGYDQKLLHFDYTSGNVLSEREIAPHAPAGEMSLSPPFIVSMAISLTGVLAAGTADGQLWINFSGGSSKDGGSKTTKGLKTWAGLNGDTEHIMKIAEGPLVAMAFWGAQILTVSTLMGTMTQYRLALTESNQLNLEKLWQRESPNSMKTNTLVVDERRIIVGGLQSDGSGVIEIWEREREMNSLAQQVQKPKLA